MALGEVAVEVADGAAKDGRGIFQGGKPVQVGPDSLAVGNQKDMDVLLKEKKSPVNALKESPAAFLNIMVCC